MVDDVTSILNVNRNNHGAEIVDRSSRRTQLLSRYHLYFILTIREATCNLMLRPNG